MMQASHAMSNERIEYTREGLVAPPRRPLGYKVRYFTLTNNTRAPYTSFQINGFVDTIRGVITGLDISGWDIQTTVRAVKLRYNCKTDPQCKKLTITITQEWHTNNKELVTSSSTKTTYLITEAGLEFLREEQFDQPYGPRLRQDRVLSTTIRDELKMFCNDVFAQGVDAIIQRVVAENKTNKGEAWIHRVKPAVNE